MEMDIDYAYVPSILYALLYINVWGLSNLWSIALCAVSERRSLNQLQL